MPTSDPRQIPAILAELRRLDPRTVLDAGAGYGKYGALIREYLDDWQWQMRIDAVEPFDDYRDRSTAIRSYSNVMATNLLDWRAGGVQWDVTLLVDVLEHFTRDDGERVVWTLLAASRYVIVATPREPSDQGEPYGNVLEVHRSRWNEADVCALAPVARFVPVVGDDQLVVTLRGAVA